MFTIRYDATRAQALHGLCREMLAWIVCLCGRGKEWVVELVYLETHGLYLTRRTFIIRQLRSRSTEKVQFKLGILRTSISNRPPYVHLPQLPRYPYHPQQPHRSIRTYSVFEVRIPQTYDVRTIAPSVRISHRSSLRLAILQSCGSTPCPTDQVMEAQRLSRLRLG